MCSSSYLGGIVGVRRVVLWHSSRSKGTACTARQRRKHHDSNTTRQRSKHHDSNALVTARNIRSLTQRLVDGLIARELNILGQGTAERVVDVTASPSISKLTAVAAVLEGVSGVCVRMCVVREW
jgi:hypothetical protein